MFLLTLYLHLPWDTEVVAVVAIEQVVAVCVVVMVVAEMTVVDAVVDSGVGEVVEAAWAIGGGVKCTTTSCWYSLLVAGLLCIDPLLPCVMKREI